MSNYAFGSVGTLTDQGNANAIPAPGAPASIAAGNLLICTVSCTTLGSTDANNPVFPAPGGGWAAIPSAQANPFVNQATGTGVGLMMGLYYKWAAGGDTMPSFALGTGATLFKYAAVAFRYTGGDGVSAPSCGFTGAPNGVSNTNIGPAPTGSLPTASWFAEVYAVRSTTNTTYGVIAGRTNRAKVFGSGGGASDITLYDSGGDASGTVGGDTGAAGTGGSWGIGALILLPVAAAGFTGWGMPL